MTKKSKARRDGLDVRKRLQTKVQQNKGRQAGSGEIEKRSNSGTPKALTVDTLAMFKESKLKMWREKRKEAMRAYRHGRISRFETNFYRSFEVLARFLNNLPDKEFVELLKEGIHDVTRAEITSKLLVPILVKAERSHFEASKGFKIKAIVLDELSKFTPSSLSNKSELIPNSTALMQAKKTLERHQCDMFTLATTCAKIMVSNERVQDRYADMLGQRQRYEELAQVLRSRMASEKKTGKAITMKSVKFLESLRRLHKVREEKISTKKVDVNVSDWNKTMNVYLPVYDEYDKHCGNLKQALSLKEKCLADLTLESEKNACDLADICSGVVRVKNDSHHKVSRSLKYKGAVKTCRDLEAKIRELTKSLDCLRKDLDFNYDRLQKQKIENEFYQLNQESEDDKGIPLIELKATRDQLQTAKKAAKQEVDNLDCKIKSIDGLLLKEQVLQEQYVQDRDVTRKQLRFLEERLVAQARQHGELKIKLAEIHRFIAFKESISSRQRRDTEETSVQTLFPVPAHLAMRDRFYA